MKRKSLTSQLTAILCLFLVAGPALAGPDEDQIAREMADAAAKAAVKEMGYEAGKSLVDLGFQNAPPPSGEQTVGSTVLSWARLGLAVNDYFQADNDKQRVFAAADVAAAGVAIACPPAGAVVALAVLAVKLVDMHFSKEHAKEMMKIALRIQAHLEAIMKTRKQMALADYLRLSSATHRMQEETIVINGLQRLIKAQCERITAANIREDDIRACLNLTVRIYPHVLNFLNLADSVTNFESPLFDKKEFYRRNNKDWDAQVQTIQTMRDNFKKTQDAAEILFGNATRLVAQAMVRKSIASGQLTPVMQLRNSCYAQLSRFNRETNLRLLPITSKSVGERRAQVAALYTEALGLNRGCLELTVDENDPLFRQLVIHERTKRAAQEFLYESAGEVLQPDEVIE